MDNATMVAKAKVCLFLALFSIFLIAYILLPSFTDASSLLQLLDIFKDPTLNFAFLVFLFLVLSLSLTFIFDVVLFLIRGKRKEQVRIGELLVAEGFIGPEDLKEALQDQDCKLGELLVKAGRITSAQRDQALRIQKKTKRKIGEVLQELGYVTPKDVAWAISQMQRRIGEILLDKKKISDYELTCATSMNKCVKDAKGDIIVVK